MNKQLTLHDAVAGLIAGGRSILALMLQKRTAHTANPEAQMVEDAVYRYREIWDPPHPLPATPITHPHATSLTPCVSVVIPAHNAERYVAATVRSVLEQRGADLEILVVDDGSTDRTVAEVRAIHDPRVTVISIAASGGAARPRNIGIQRARAPYVSLLDADDLLKPGKLAASVAALERCPSAGFAFGDFERMDEDGNVFETSTTYAYPALQRVKSRPVGEGWRLVPQAELARALAYENFIGTSGIVIRRDLAMTLGGFDETLENAEDVDLWFRFAHRCDALYCADVGHACREETAGVVRGSLPIRNALFRIEALRRERARWRGGPERRQLDRRIALNLETIGYFELLRGERWRAMRSYLHALAVSPERSAIFNTLLTHAISRGIPGRGVLRKGRRGHIDPAATEASGRAGLSAAPSIER